MKEIFVLVGLGFLSFVSLTQQATAAKLNALYPLYNYPNWYAPESYIWNEIGSASKDINITTIINPDNGPGLIGSPNIDYHQGLTDLAKGSANIIGYVSTNYGNRDINDVKADILKYNRDFNTENYTVTGIFFDEVSISSDSSFLNYYRKLYDFVKNSADTPTLDFVVFNHGTNAPEIYLNWADVNVIYEGSFSNWYTYTPDSYISNYPLDRLGSLVYSAEGVTDMQAALDLARDRNIGYAFVTDDSLPNPWNKLPSYWNEEVNYMSTTTVPTPSAIYLSGTWLIMILFKKKKVKEYFASI